MKPPHTLADQLETFFLQELGASHFSWREVTKFFLEKKRRKNGKKKKKRTRKKKERGGRRKKLSSPPPPPSLLERSETPGVLGRCVH